VPWKHEPVTEFGLAFMAGLAGSGHCLGMCGGILAALAVASPGTSAGNRFRLNLAYHIGRIITYSLLGLLAGALSQAALFTALKPHLYWLFAVANLMVIFIGLATAFGFRRLSLAALDGAGWGFMSRVLGMASTQATLQAFLMAGLVMGLLPCGLVYGVLITAATGGSWWQGGGMMLAFGLGTLPALLAFGQVATALGAIATTVFLRIMGLLVALLGAAGLVKTLITIGVMPPITLW
jgi:sulfite exporter TauE/SafE